MRTIGRTRCWRYLPSVLIAVLFFPISSLAEKADVRLLLQISVDGLRADRIALGLPEFGDAGFRRLLENGAVFSNAHYQHANTETIVGHTTLATGAHPSVHGMTGNVWYDAADDELSYNIEDPEYLPLPTRELARTGEQVDPAQLLARTTGRSPRAILAETLADKMSSATGGRAKVFAVSNKDRSAVAMGGQKGKAFWMSTDTGDYGTTEYYYYKYPDWVSAWNGERQAEHLASTTWSLLGAPATYSRLHEDDRPYETDLRGFGRVFPHRYGEVDNKLLYAQVLSSPPGDALLADFATSLIENESLGQDDIVDYLSVSFSGVDAVNHFFGASSLESEDMLRQLDKTLGEFFDYLDKEIGLEKVVLVLSADHGNAEAPEYLQSKGLPAGRLYPEQIIDAANKLGSQLFDIEDIVKFYYRPYVYLRADLIEAAGLDLAEVSDAISDKLVDEPGIHAASTKNNNRLLADKELAERIRNNYHPERAGDIYIVQDLYWFNFDRGPVAVMHGSPWSYDTHIPVIFMGPGVRSGETDRQIQPIDIAPTLAALLGLPPLASAQGELLTEVFEPQTSPE